MLEKSAFMMDSPSAAIVPLPTEVRNGLSCLTVFAEVRAGLPHLVKVVAEPAQVVDDVGGVTEQTHVKNLLLVVRAIARWTQ